LGSVYDFRDKANSRSSRLRLNEERESSLYFWIRIWGLFTFTLVFVKVLASITVFGKVLFIQMMLSTCAFYFGACNTKPPPPPKKKESVKLAESTI
jgi:hypothetical protein